MTLRPGLDDPPQEIPLMTLRPGLDNIPQYRFRGAERSGTTVFERLWPQAFPNVPLLGYHKHSELFEWEATRGLVILYKHPLAWAVSAWRWSVNEQWRGDAYAGQSFAGGTFAEYLEANRPLQHWTFLYRRWFDQCQRQRVDYLVVEHNELIEPVKLMDRVGKWLDVKPFAAHLPKDHLRMRPLRPFDASYYREEKWRYEFDNACLVLAQADIGMDVILKLEDATGSAVSDWGLRGDADIEELEDLGIRDEEE